MILVGGVGELYQGDLDLGRRAVEMLTAEHLGGDVAVEDLYYGALAVAQRLEDSRPDAMVLIGAAARGRPPGSVDQRFLVEPSFPDDQIQAAIQDAGTGYVDIDTLLRVCAGLKALPRRTLVIEVEPMTKGPDPEISPQVGRALDEALSRVRSGVRHLRLLNLADQIAQRLDEGDIEGTPVTKAMEDLLASMRSVEGGWGRTFAEKDKLKLLISSRPSGEGMRQLDWALWWTLIEQLDRLEQSEALELLQ
jgi:hydrogenase maturation protease